MTRTSPGRAIATVHVNDDVTQEERHRIAQWLQRQAQAVLRGEYANSEMGHWARIVRE